MPKPGTASLHASQAPSALLDLIGAPQRGAGMPELQGTGGRYREDIWGGIAR